VYTKDYEQVPVVIKPMSESDAEQTNQTPVWQSSWTSDYLNDDRLDKYAVKKNDELIGLGAYEINDDALIVHIVYMESHPESNPTIVGDEQKFHGIGRLLIAYGIKLSIDNGFNGDVVLEQRLLNLHDTMSKTMARLVYRHLVPVHHGF
jgi:hypothetical protein